MPVSPDGKTEQVDQDVKDQVADSSTDTEEGEKELTTLEVVTSVLEAKEESPASEEPDPKSQEEQTDESGADKDEESSEDDKADKAESDEEEEVSDDDAFTEEEKKHLSEKTQRRIKSLIDAKKTLTVDNDAFKPKAENYDRIVQFAQTNKLTRDDLDNTFKIAALVRNDPVEALKTLEPIVAQLKQATGEVISEDLQEKVRLGYLTEDGAKEIAGARAQKELVDRREQERSEDDRRADQQRDVQQQQTDAIAAADEWYADQAAKDPDFELKKDRVAEKAELEIHRLNKMPTPAEAKALLNDVKRRVDAEFKKLMPKPREVDEVIDETASPEKKPEPTSTLDVIDNVLSG